MPDYKDCVYVAADGSWGDAENLRIFHFDDLTAEQWEEVGDAADGAAAILKFLKENDH